jgi:anthranilate/para-aminobenzoate synthase component I
MKGTAARGRTTAEERLQANQLKVSPKNRAETL